MNRAMLLVCCLLPWIVPCDSSNGATLRVPLEFTTIQAAIDAAVDGDSVLVAAGVYMGDGNRDLTFRGKRILLIGTEGADATVIECEGDWLDPHGGVWLRDDEPEGSLIQGLTIRGAYGYTAGAICCEGNATVLVRACRLVANTWDWYLEGAGGGGVTSKGSARIRVEFSMIEENRLGIWVRDAAALEMIDCLVRENLGTGIGVSENAHLRLVECRLFHNFGGAIKAEGGSQISLDRCEVIGNHAEYWPAGVLVYSPNGSVEITRSTIAGNRSEQAFYGAGVYVEADRFHLSRTIVQGNWTDCYSEGLEIRVRCSEVTFDCCAYSPNELQVDGGTEVEYLGEQVFDWPEFCDPLECLEAPANWDYQLATNSPCLPQNNPCGVLIGALGEGCGGPPVTGACCLTDDECVVMELDDCELEGGAYLGDGTECEPNPCIPTARERTTWGRLRHAYR